MACIIGYNLRLVDDLGSSSNNNSGGGATMDTKVSNWFNAQNPIQDCAKALMGVNPLTKLTTMHGVGAKRKAALTTNNGNGDFK